MQGSRDVLLVFRDLQEMAAASEVSMVQSTSAPCQTETSTHQEETPNRDATVVPETHSKEVPHVDVGETATDAGQNPAQEIGGGVNEDPDGCHGDIEPSLPAAISETGEEDSTEEGDSEEAAQMVMYNTSYLSVKQLPGPFLITAF